ncbi:MAG TPA: DinB family protein [Streptosporangiaceae bacterium]|nr:DinB family protein [Streptosporangiaceae bacterium]
MTIAELLADAFGRVHATVHAAVDGLTPGQLAFRPESGANSIAWLAWHLTRIQDDHIADVAGTGQVWTSTRNGTSWADRFGLPFATSATGYGHGSEAVAAVQVESGELLTGYFDAVHEETLRYVAELTDPDLDRIVDKAWDPPVTLGVRLVSVINDDLQHAGQAAYLRGIIERS